jgi:hypothetical protein
VKIARIGGAVSHGRPSVFGSERDDVLQGQKQGLKRDEPTRKSEQPPNVPKTKGYHRFIVIRKVAQYDQGQELTNKLAAPAHNGNIEDET